MNYDISKQDLANVNNAINSSERIIEELRTSIEVVNFLIEKEAEPRLIKRAMVSVFVETVKTHNNEIRKKYHYLLEKLGIDVERLTYEYGED